MKSGLKPVQIVVAVLVATVGVCCLATAIPNFLHFGARSKQSEAKAHLREVMIAQRAFFADQGRWAGSFEELGLVLERGNRYRVALSQDGEVLAPGHPDGGPHAILAVDDFRFGPGVPDAAHPPAMPRVAWEQLGVQGGALTVVATGNIDVDATLDVWSISSAGRVIDGRPVDAGVPYCHVDDTKR